MATRGKEPGTMTRWGSSDEQLLRRLQAPPDLNDGVQALEYWRRRSRQLPWYRFRARREAVRMTICWEQRVGAALVSTHRATLEARVAAGALVARTRLTRWTRRAGFAAVAVVTTAIVFVAVPIVAALLLLLHAF